MGYNIGVSGKIQTEFECDFFIDRAFYNFVSSGEAYGERSILIRSGQYYQLDLSPLLKIVYTWDEVTEEYINENIQDLEFLLDLTMKFRQGIIKDNSVCEKIEYMNEEELNLTHDEIDQIISASGKDLPEQFLTMIEDSEGKKQGNSNPWKWYFEEGQIIEDLGNLIKSIQCYQEKGATQVYLTAG